MKKKCNICDQKFIDTLSLGKHPCADTFLKNKTKAQKLKRFPLIVGFCKCSHMTSIYPVQSYNRYEKYDYSYTSDNSPVSRLHFKNIACSQASSEENDSSKISTGCPLTPVTIPIL